VNAWLNIPIEARTAIVFFVGLCLGGLANLAVRRLGARRASAARVGALPVRPWVVVLLCGIGFAWLYWWEIGRRGLLPPAVPPAIPLGMATVLHAEFAAHVVLIVLMVVASLIDLDEWVIPDGVTMPGTIAGLLAAYFWPWSLLPNLVPPVGVAIPPAWWNQWSAANWPWMSLTAPLEWPAALYAWPGLSIALGCWWAWCAALLPRTWYPRHGWRRAAQLCWTRVVRERSTFIVAGTGVVGSGAIVAAWFAGGLHWKGLLTGLAGMAIGGGIVWAVRVIGTAALRREAMGFGDVTLMAMIGTFLGCQACLIVFFLAPFAGLVVGLFRLLLFRQRELPYGHYLCLAAAALIACWASLWERMFGIFAVPGLVPVTGAFCLAALAFLLTVWRIIQRAFGRCG
jgi:prepilin signal peptidase PulO-like enzyme (type II secretory pathway)